MTVPFRDRKHAGEVLAQELDAYRGTGAAILSIPNGGVAVAAPISELLHLPIDLIIVRKIPIPGTTEAGFGSIASDGSMFLNNQLVQRLHLSPDNIEELAKPVLEQIRTRIDRYGVKGDYGLVRDKTAILVDDGLASGVTMEAAIYTVQKYEPTEIIVAAPTASKTAIDRISPLVTRIVCPNIRDSYYFAVADAYENWHDLEDEDVVAILAGFHRSGGDPLSP